MNEAKLWKKILSRGYRSSLSLSEIYIDKWLDMSSPPNPNPDPSPEEEEIARLAALAALNESTI